MRHANGVSPRMRSWLHRFLTSFSVMALVALGAIAAAVPFVAMSDAASPAIAASEAPLPANAAADPAVVVSQSACTDLGTCVAVGSYEDTNGVQQSLIETYSSGAWSPSEGALPTKCRRHPRSQSRCRVLSSVWIMCGDRLVFRPRRQPTGFRRHPGARRVGPGRRVVAAERRGKSGRATAWHFVRDHELMRGRGYLPGQ